MTRGGKHDGSLGFKEETTCDRRRPETNRDGGIDPVIAFMVDSDLIGTF